MSLSRLRIGNVNPIYGGVDMETVISIVSQINFNPIKLRVRGGEE